MPDWSMPIAQAQALLAAGQTARAVADLRRLVQRDPRDPALREALASALLRTADMEQAIFHAREGLASCGDQPFLLYNLAAIASVGGADERILAALRRSVDVDPTNPKAWAALGRVLRELKRPTEALEVFDAALMRTPMDVRLITLRAATLLDVARADETVRALQHALTLPGVGEDPAILQLLASALNYAPGGDAAFIAQIHRRAGAAIARVAGVTGPISLPRRPLDGRRLRVGFLSCDFREHPVGRFAAPLLKHLPRDRFEVFGYSTCVPDAMTAHVRTLVDRWVDFVRKPEAEMPARIASDQLDVLIELSGLTQGHRLVMLSRRVAPVQMTAIGYPNTTGVPNIDLRLVDSVTDPPGSEERCTESLLRVDPCFVCYEPPSDAPDVRPRDADRPVTFVSFNATAKLNDPLFALWARVLAAVPHARLVLKTLELSSDSLRVSLQQRLSRAGVDVSRVDLLPPTSTRAAHLDLYQRADIALDTFPYHGTTTTCEALWMGLPVVSLRGGTHASRVGASLLSAAGAPEWIAHSEDHYVEVAVELARDAARLASIRAGLRGRLRASTLCDAPAYGARTGAALRAACDHVRDLRGT